MAWSKVGASAAKVVKAATAAFVLVSPQGSTNRNEVDLPDRAPAATAAPTIVRTEIGDAINKVAGTEVVSSVPDQFVMEGCLAPGPGRGMFRMPEKAPEGDTYITTTIRDGFAVEGFVCKQDSASTENVLPPAGSVSGRANDAVVTRVRPASSDSFGI